MSVRILHGDCREVLATLPEASVDAIVCDPPYELTAARPGGRSEATRGAVMGGFMGMKWDGTGVAFDVETWRQALRVLKPGGHLLAFSGTRTYHRMVCAIEDAGFEVRDQLQWIYASGFPKSLNLDNERGKSICGCDRPTNHSASNAEPALHGLRDDVSLASVACEADQDAQLQPAMQWSSARRGMGEARPQGCGGAQDVHASSGQQQSGLEGRCDASASARELCAGAICASAGMGAADGPEGRLCHGAPAADGGMVRLSADADGGGAPRRSRPAAKRAAEPRTVAGQPQPQARGAWPVCGGCGLPILPRGLGTALKPANEPIVLARRPLIGTVAANVLAHGTGALNIDGCRVPTDDKLGGGNENLKPREHTEGWDRPWMHDEAVTAAHSAKVRANVEKAESLGRWPANIIHDGSEEVLAAFPEGSFNKPVERKSDAPTGLYEGQIGNAKAGTIRSAFGDTGSAARFFYTAKANGADRSDGLQTVSGKGRNHHPTVKPTELMRYLCRLVTPPGGTVLDPFMGSGSTLKAAELEGFSAIGIELDPEYIEIARRRIAADAPLFAEVTCAP